MLVICSFYFCENTLTLYVAALVSLNARLRESDVHLNQEELMVTVSSYAWVVR